MAINYHLTVVVSVVSVVVLVFITLSLVFVFGVAKDPDYRYTLFCNITGQVTNQTWSYSAWKNLNNTQIFCTHGRCVHSNCRRFNDTTCTQVKELSQCL